jgi:hypothetical protein
MKMLERTFVRVYRMPEKLINGYCFETGTGNPITMQNVDWFEAPIAAGRDELVRFIKSKRYYSAVSDFLVLGDHPDFTFRILREGIE